MLMAKIMKWLHSERDIGVADGRRPEETARGTIQDDALRRDLTMNNLYYDFDKKIILDFNQMVKASKMHKMELQDLLVILMKDLMKIN